MSTVFRKTLLCLVAVFAMSAAGASIASAAEPEFVFTGAGQAGKEFTSTSGAGTLQTASGTTVTCTSNTDTGEIKGASPSKEVAKVQVEFKGCKSAGHKCTSVDPAGTNENIVTNKLEGTLGNLTNPTTEEETIGLELKPEAPATVFADFDCGTTIDVEVRGSIICAITPVDTKVGPALVTKAFTLTCKKGAGAGKQEWANFFGGAEDVLEATFNEGVTWEKAAIETNAEIFPKVGEVEIKA